MPTTVVQNLPKILSENLPQIEAACHQFGIKRLFVFGSALSDRFTDASDIDFLYEFDDSES